MTNDARKRQDSHRDGVMMNENTANQETFVHVCCKGVVSEATSTACYASAAAAVSDGDGKGAKEAILNVIPNATDLNHREVLQQFKLAAKKRFNATSQASSSSD